MKHKELKIIITLVVLMTTSCNEPETVVTNIVHPDGSVTRRIEMKNLENKFEISEIQVPFDSTWTVRDSIEVTKEGDTIWVKRAEKLFTSIEAINSDYKTDSGANKDVSRRAEFRKRFKWFNTEYNFAEIIDKKMQFGYLISEFLDQEELKWFYSPDNLNEEKKNGRDSLLFRALDDTVDKKLEKWYLKSLLSEWIGEFASLAGEKAKDEMDKDSLKQREDEFVRIVERDLEHFDSLWQNGILLREFIGEANALVYKTEADSAAKIATEHFSFNFKPYTVKAIIPGKVTDTNGFIDSTGILLWPVNSDFFLTEPYEMMAESKVQNLWAWIVSGLFLLFVISGIIIRKKGKG